MGLGFLQFSSTNSASPARRNADLDPSIEVHNDGATQEGEPRRDPPEKEDEIGFRERATFDVWRRLLDAKPGANRRECLRN